MDIGPIRPRNIATIIISFPTALSVGVSALESPTVAVALNISYIPSTREMSFVARSSINNINVTIKLTKMIAEAL